MDMKIPKYIFSFDAESDGLAGESFAIGAIVIDWQGVIVEKFTAIAEAESVTNHWVQTNVLPHLQNLKVYSSKKEMREAFWQFWMKYKNESLALADIGVPVEANLLNTCIHDDLDAREFQGPYPLYDLSAFLLIAGHHPIDLQRKIFVDRTDLMEHNPLDDALATALTLIKIQNETNILNLKKQN